MTTNIAEGDALSIDLKGLNKPGKYKIKIVIEFPNGQIFREDMQVKVLENPIRSKP